VLPGAPPALGASFDFVSGTNLVQLRSDSGLCMGVVGQCSCSHPISPRLGLVKCSASDPAQKWAVPGSDGVLAQLPAGGGPPSHCVNGGPQCKGDKHPNLLLYQTQVQWYVV
jgi:hypothetical protein